LFSDKQGKKSNSNETNSEDAAKCTERWSKKKNRTGKRKRRSYFDKAEDSNNPDTMKFDKSTANEPAIDHETSGFHITSIPHCPWGGTDGNIILSNTCTVDNLLFLMHQLIMSKDHVRQWLETSTEPVAQTLIRVSDFFAKGDWFAGKMCWITSHVELGTSTNHIDLYGTEHAQFVRHYGVLQMNSSGKKCSSSMCKLDHQISSGEIILP
jgi:hypothetical protein